MDFDGWTMTLNVNNLLHNLIDCINIWFSCSWWSVLYWWSARVFGVHWNWRTIRGFVILLFIAVKYSWTRSRAISRSSEQLFQVSEIVYVCIGVKSHNKRVKWFWYVCGHFNGKNILVSSSNILQFCVLTLLEKENVFSSSNSLFIVKLKPSICSSLQISSGHSSSRCWDAPWLSYQCRQVPAVLVFRCGSSSILWLWMLSISSRFVFNTMVRSLFCDCCCGHHSTRGRNVSCLFGTFSIMIYRKFWFKRIF